MRLPAWLRALIHIGEEPVDKIAWETPALQLYRSWVAPSESGRAMDDAAYALSQQHQDDLARFEAALTMELQAKGMPMVFIQLGAPGHKEAVRAARKHLVQDFATTEPIRPCDHVVTTKGCRACEFLASKRPA